MIGADISPTKVAMVQDGRSPVVEPGPGRLIDDMVKAGRLQATLDLREATQRTHTSVVCVGTPQGAGGTAMLAALFWVCEEIGLAL